MKSVLLLALFLILTVSNFAQKVETTYKTVSNLPYRTADESKTDEYMKSRCMLDVYYPTNIEKFSTVVFFHGGNIQAGEKFFPKELQNQNIAIVTVNYRLSPKAQYPAYIDDAAAAVAWTFKNIEKYGGDPNSIFVAGHSAGGYLTLMVGLDTTRLQKYNVDANNIAGLFPVSPQTITHSAIREERKLELSHRISDEAAPLNYTRANAPLLMLVTGGRDLEIPARYEESALLFAFMKSMNAENNYLFELNGFDHGNVLAPACYLIVDQINKLKKKE